MFLYAYIVATIFLFSFWFFVPNLITPILGLFCTFKIITLVFGTKKDDQEIKYIPIDDLKI